MPKLIARGYDEDKILARVVAMYEGPVNDERLNDLREMRAAMEMELRKATATGDARRFNALRDALEDMSS